jgi:hypothetical protein
MAPKSVFIYNHLGDSLKSIPLYYIPLVLFSFAIAFIVKRRCLSPLRRFPGPFWASVTRWWLVREIFRGDHEKNMLRLHARYGPIVRISPFEVAISDPDAIKVIYGHTSGFIKVHIVKLGKLTSRANGMIHGGIEPPGILLYLQREMRELMPSEDEMLRMRIV